MDPVVLNAWRGHLHGVCSVARRDWKVHQKNVRAGITGMQCNSCLSTIEKFVVSDQ
jgi:hypothetical protein